MLGLANDSHAQTAAACPAGGVSTQAAALSVRQRRRESVAVAAIVASSVLWISGLTALGIASQVMPWFITLTVIAVSALLSLAMKSRVDVLTLVSPGERRPVTFVESYALTYTGISLLLCGWILYHQIIKPPAPVVQRQVIDIELSGQSDYVDNHELLPSTADQSSVRKRTSSDRETMQGSLASTSSPSRQVKAQALPQAAPAHPAPVSSASTRASPAPEHPETAEKRPLSERFAAETSPAVIPQTARSERTPAPAALQSNSHFWEEVAPPEMVELTDNEGDQSISVAQLGGRSAGGTGAKSELSRYLKELQRRVKRAWNPPRGESKTVEILFRIRRNGQLASIRVVRSSEDGEADRAAVESIAGSAPFRALPAEFPSEYIDVRYAFNYSTDSLREISTPAP